MKKLELKPISHNAKIGQTCEYIEPNITENSIFYSDGEPVGFYLSKIEGKFKELIEIANKELLSDRVPKSEMRRSSGLHEKEKDVKQYSTIIGSCAPKPHMRRPYPSISSVHRVKSAQNFIKAMLLAAQESEALIQKFMPQHYEKQKAELERVPKEWRFANLFTSSISNYNISAPYHQDNGNIRPSVNVIITKRQNSTGGSLAVPDYGAVFEQADNSMLVYPAWRNVHGVTPIVQTHDGGYRNSLIFYALKAFQQ